METDENQKDYKRKKFRSLLNPCVVIIDENQERVEWGVKRREKRDGLLLPIHTSWQKTRHRKGATHKRTRVLKLFVGYHNLGTLNALDISRVLSGAVVTARTKEILRAKTVQAYKDSSTGGPKDSRRHGIRLPLIHSPL
jgi:hypothetical protein